MPEFVPSSLVLVLLAVLIKKPFPFKKRKKAVTGMEAEVQPAEAHARTLRVRDVDDPQALGDESLHFWDPPFLCTGSDQELHRRSAPAQSPLESFALLQIAATDSGPMTPEPRDETPSSMDIFSSKTMATATKGVGAAALGVNGPLVCVSGASELHHRNLARLQIATDSGPMTPEPRDSCLVTSAARTISSCHGRVTDFLLVLACLGVDVFVCSFV